MKICGYNISLLYIITTYILYLIYIHEKLITLFLS